MATQDSSTTRVSRISLATGALDTVVSLNEALDKLVPAYYIDREPLAQAIMDGQSVRSTAFEYRLAVLPIQTQDGLEFPVEWTCPNCQSPQVDTVHPQMGPFLSATCGECGNLFDDADLSENDRLSWNDARDRAENAQCTWTDNEQVLTGPHQWEGGKCATCGEVS